MTYFKIDIAKLVKKHETNDPFQLARSLGIVILFMDLGEVYGFFGLTKE